MIKVGLTGGIACGKTTVAKMLADKGAVLIDADLLAREAVEPGKPAWKEIVNWLGEDILMDDGNLDRQKIAGLVFNDQQSLEKLNAIIHPRVMELFEEKSSFFAKKYPGAIQIWDIPLLFETGAQHRLDYVVVVSSSEENQLKRLFERNGLSKADALKRIRAQLDLKKKISKADYVIHNDGTKKYLQKQVDKLWNKLNKTYC